jgi:acyl-coenzyme A synthetase/AMP-(fatty) acid ligase
MTSAVQRVSAKEIEEVISEIPEVIEVAVVGMPHGILGESGVAFVAMTAKGEDRISAILDHCRRRLPPFKVPTQVICLPSLPHGANGKVIKGRLKEAAVAAHT